jgi:transcriptional regulator with XRE-family HTH domain
MRRDRLIAARKATGKSQEQIAQELKVDRTTIGTWERGEYSPQPYQRHTYALALGITMDELDAMLSSIPAGANEAPDWLVNYLASEQSATDLLAHEPRAVYGLFQAPSYVESLVGRLGITGVSDTYLQRTVEQRLHRQKRVRDGDLTLDVIQPESALHLQVGDSEIMANQLDTLAELATLDNVTVRVMRYSAGQYEARRLGDFTIMTHPWGNPRVHIEGYGGGQFITDAEEVGYFAAAFDNAARLALSPSESIKFVEQLATEWRQSDV